ncbi:MULTISPECIES: hypothetical protein [Streptomyces]|uniref:hypothetical protein n=1 Tax=Streptomyces TaxID=1883 RepID=UPI0001B4EB49|nr:MULTISPECIES: hypothetical protein [Streptomyces]
MLRTLRCIATIAAVIGISCAPSTAIADDYTPASGHYINHTGPDTIPGGPGSPGGPQDVDTTLVIVNTLNSPAILLSQTGDAAFFPSRVDPMSASGARIFALPASAVYQVGPVQVTIALDEDGNPSCTTTGDFVECVINELRPNLIHFNLIF